MAGLHGRFGIAILYSDGVSCGDWSMQVCAHEGQLSLFYTLFQPAELEMVVWRALPPSRCPLPRVHAYTQTRRTAAAGGFGCDAQP